MVESVGGLDRLDRKALEDLGRLVGLDARQAKRDLLPQAHEPIDAVVAEVEGMCLRGNEQTVLYALKRLSDPALKCVAFMLDRCLRGLMLDDSLKHTVGGGGLSVDEVNNLSKAPIIEKMYVSAFGEGRNRGVIELV